MTDKVQKIREEITKKLEVMQYQIHRKDAYKELKSILNYMDSLQEEPNILPVFDEGYWERLGEEPVSKDYRERYKRIAESEEFRKNYDGMSIGDIVPVKEQESVSEDFEKIVEEIAEPTILNAYGTKELARRLRSTICGTSVSEDLEEELDSYIKDNFTIDKEQLDRFGIEEKDYMYSMDKIDILTMVSYFTNLQKEKDIEIITDVEAVAFANGMAQMKKQIEEFVSEDLGEYINELSKQFPEVSFAKLSRIAVRVAKWQKNHLWKPADGDDLPKIDREVIALLDNGKVVFAHRPPEYWDGKDIVTGKVTRNYPKTYDKGGWNIPNVKFWLDCLLPKEIEL